HTSAARIDSSSHVLSSVRHLRCGGENILRSTVDNGPTKKPSIPIYRDEGLLRGSTQLRIYDLKFSIELQAQNFKSGALWANRKSLVKLVSGATRAPILAGRSVERCDAVLRERLGGGVRLARGRSRSQSVARPP